MADNGRDVVGMSQKALFCFLPNPPLSRRQKIDQSLNCAMPFIGRPTGEHSATRKNGDHRIFVADKATAPGGLGVPHASQLEQEPQYGSQPTPARFRLTLAPTSIIAKRFYKRWQSGLPELADRPLARWPSHVVAKGIKKAREGCQAQATPKGLDNTWQLTALGEGQQQPEHAVVARSAQSASGGIQHRLLTGVFNRVAKLTCRLKELYQNVLYPKRTKSSTT